MMNRKQKVVTLANLTDTQSLGIGLGNMLQPGDTLLLFGDLGAGKTTLTQSIAQGLNVPAEYYVTSPSFALLHEYPGRLPLYHMDCYRLSGEDDIEAAGLSEYLRTPKGVCIIEWPERLGSLTPENALKIKIISLQEDRRQIVFVPGTADWSERIQALTSQQCQVRGKT